MTQPPPSQEPLPPPPGQPAQPAQPAQPGPPGTQGAKNGLAVASMVLGIIGIVLWFFIIPQILAIIFGGVALMQLKRPENVQTGRGMAIAGLVLGIISIVGLVILIATADNSGFYFEVNS